MKCLIPQAGNQNNHHTVDHAEHLLGCAAVAVFYMQIAAEELWCIPNTCLLLSLCHLKIM